MPLAYRIVGKIVAPVVHVLARSYRPRHDEASQPLTETVILNFVP